MTLVGDRKLNKGRWKVKDPKGGKSKKIIKGATEEEEKEEKEEEIEGEEEEIQEKGEREER